MEQEATSRECCVVARCPQRLWRNLIGPFQNWPTSPIGCPMICWRASPLQILCLQNCFNLLTNFVFTFLIVILCCCDSAYCVNFVSVCECKLNQSESTLMGHYSSRPEATLPGGVYVRARVIQSVHLSARLPSFKQAWLLRFHFVKLSNSLSLICAKSIKRNGKLTEETETVCLDSKSFFPLCRRRHSCCFSERWWHRAF